jgi:hypothetical protein
VARGCRVRTTIVVVSTKPDWIHLPPDAEQVSLWPCLHDARIQEAKSDRLARTVQLDFDVFYIREHHGLPVDFRFLLGISGVESARATEHNPWPGDYERPPGISRDEELRLVEEYQAKWREDSMSWTDFERAVAGGEHEILEAALARADGLGLHLVCIDETANRSREVFVRGKALSVVGSDGTDFGIERFLAMGEAYWEAFEKE